MVNLSIPARWDDVPLDDKNKHSGQQHATLLVMFYEPPANDPFINRAVAWLDGPFSHTEVGFTDGMASSIYAGEKVFMHPRRFANPNYTVVSVQVTKEQEELARQFCTDRAQRGIEFDGVGMYTAPLPLFCKSIVSFFRGSRSAGRTFCSKHVVETFQHIRMDGFMEVDASSMTPSMVHRALGKCTTQVMATTAYKRGLLSMNGVMPV